MFKKVTYVTLHINLTDHFERFVLNSLLLSLTNIAKEAITLCNRCVEPSLFSFKFQFVHTPFCTNVLPGKNTTIGIIHILLLSI